MNDERNGENGFEPEDMEQRDEHTEGDLEEERSAEDAEAHAGDDEPTGEAGGDASDDEPSDEDAGDGPAPATFAGRRQWSGLPSSGLTEESDELEHEIDEGDEESDETDGDVDAVADEHDEDAGRDEGGELDESDFAGEHAPPVAEDEDAEDVAESEDEADEAEAPEAKGAGSGETIEADTPVLADQEEAREKAMSGLRARTQEGQAKRGVPEPAASEGEDATEAEAATEVAESPAETEEPPVAAVAAAVAREEAPANEQKAPKSWLWARFVTASFLIIVSMATATSVSLLVYLTDIAKGLGGLEGLRGQLDDLDEQAQNFLIIGSDVRPDDEGHGLSDTTMLLRVDPDRNVISQLSIPRDLRVNIPRHGLDKFNAAYSYGGPTLTLKTIKDLTEDRIDIDHVVNVDFNGFADAVDAIGCVYIDVDRHYYVPPEEDYAEIDVPAGYQRMCGYKALQYVRFRHADNDIVRAARQQGFLREARQKVPPSELLEKRNQLIDIFKKYTTSDIDDVGTLVGLFKLMLQARNAQVNQVTFRTESLNDEGYVTASDEGVQTAVTEFLNGGEEPESDGAKPDGGDTGDKGGGKPDKKPKEEPKPQEPPPPPPMIDSTATGQALSVTLAQDAGNEIKFPILYPTRIVPGSSISDTDTRWFRVDGPGKDIYRGYKFVMPTQTDNGTEYYGVSGTNWLDAPLFANPSEEREINDRSYKLYYDAGQLRMIAFERDKTMYWVTNTLDKGLDNAEMLAIVQNPAVPGG